MDDSAVGVLIVILGDSDNLVKDGVVPKYLSQGVSVDAVKRLLVVYEVDEEGGVPF